MANAIKSQQSAITLDKEKISVIRSRLLNPLPRLSVATVLIVMVTLGIVWWAFIETWSTS